MSIESDYYENPDFWVEELFATSRERFEIVTELIPETARSLIDLGCGNGAFVHFLANHQDRLNHIHATDRSSTALAHVRVEKTQASLDALPFADRAFDVATCLEVIEHLPVATYRKAIGEIARVARTHVLIGVPFNEDIEAALIRCPSCTTRFNPDYHMRRFSESDMDGLLLGFGYRPVAKAFAGGMADYGLISRFQRWRQHRRATGNPFHTAIQCPMCGHALPPSVGAAPSDAPVAASGGSGPKAWIKRLLRRGTTYGWIVALYERSPAIE